MEEEENSFKLHSSSSSVVGYLLCAGLILGPFPSGCPLVCSCLCTTCQDPTPTKHPLHPSTIPCLSFSILSHETGSRTLYDTAQP